MASGPGGDLRSLLHVDSLRCLRGVAKWVTRCTDLEYNELVNGTQKFGSYQHTEGTESRDNG